MKIELYLNTNCGVIKKNLDKKDKRKIKKYKSLLYNKDFQSSRILKTHIKKKRKLCIAHKNGISVIINSKIKCGVDIEELKTRNFSELAKIFANEKELLWIEDNCKRFYMIFCAKEAIIKLFNLDFSFLNKIILKNICNIYIEFSYNDHRINCFYYMFMNHIICVAIRSNKCLRML